MNRLNNIPNTNIKQRFGTRKIHGKLVSVLLGFTIVFGAGLISQEAHAMEAKAENPEPEVVAEEKANLDAPTPRITSIDSDDETSKYSGCVRIRVQDKKTGTDVHGAEVEIYDENKEYIGKIGEREGHAAGQYANILDNSGKIEMKNTYNGIILPLGKYYYKVVKTPEGYIENTELQSFRIMDIECSDDIIFIEKEITKTYEADISIVDDMTLEPIDIEDMEIYKEGSKEPILVCNYRNGEFETNQTNNIIGSDNTKLNLPAGKYQIKITKPPFCENTNMWQYPLEFEIKQSDNYKYEKRFEIFHNNVFNLEINTIFLDTKGYVANGPTETPTKCYIKIFTEDPTVNPKIEPIIFGYINEDGSLDFSKCEYGKSKTNYYIKKINGDISKHKSSIWLPNDITYYYKIYTEDYENIRYLKNDDPNKPMGIRYGKDDKTCNDPNGERWEIELTEKDHCERYGRFSPSIILKYDEINWNEPDPRKKCEYEILIGYNGETPTTPYFKGTFDQHGRIKAANIIDIYTNNPKHQELLKGPKNGIETGGIFLFPKYRYAIRFNRLPAGYTILDSGLEPFYDKGLQPIEFQIDPCQNNSSLNFLLKKQKCTSIVEFKATDASTCEAVDNAVIELHKCDENHDEIILVGRTDKDGHIRDQNGYKARIELESGHYYFVMKQAPDGYILNDEKQEFTVPKTKCEIVKMEIKATRKPPEEHPCEIMTTFRETKSGENIDGAKVSLYKQTENGEDLLASFTTSKEDPYMHDEYDNIARIELAPGKYFYKIENVPDDYEIIEDIYDFSVTDSTGKLCPCIEMEVKKKELGCIEFEIIPPYKNNYPLNVIMTLEHEDKNQPPVKLEIYDGKHLNIIRGGEAQNINIKDMTLYLEPGQYTLHADLHNTLDPLNQYIIKNNNKYTIEVKSNKCYKQDIHIERLNPSCMYILVLDQYGGGVPDVEMELMNNDFDYRHMLKTTEEGFLNIPLRHDNYHKYNDLFGSQGIYILPNSKHYTYKIINFPKGYYTSLYQTKNIEKVDIGKCIVIKEEIYNRSAGCIQNQILDSDGQPIQNAIVEITKHGDENFYIKTTTDRRGYISKKNIMTGSQFLYKRPNLYTSDEIVIDTDDGPNKFKITITPPTSKYLESKITDTIELDGGTCSYNNYVFHEKACFKPIVEIPASTTLQKPIDITIKNAKDMEILSAKLHENGTLSDVNIKNIDKNLVKVTENGELYLPFGNYKVFANYEDSLHALAEKEITIEALEGKCVDIPVTITQIHGCSNVSVKDGEGNPIKDVTIGIMEKGKEDPVLTFKTNENGMMESGTIKILNEGFFENGNIETLITENGELVLPFGKYQAKVLECPENYKPVKELFDFNVEEDLCSLALITLEKKEPPITPEEPETPDVPDTPDTPDNPDTPDTPDEPDVPDVPDEPTQPNEPTSETPANPEPTKPNKPEIKNTPVETGDMTKGFANGIMLSFAAAISMLFGILFKRKSEK